MMKIMQANYQQTHIRKSKRRAGSAIAELPPALIMIFFILFFPMIDLMYMALAFGVGWYLNTIELREVACRTPASLGLPFPPDGTYHIIPPGNLPPSDNWQGLMGVSETRPPSPEVAQFPAGGASVVTSKVRTTVSIKPLFLTSFLGSTPIVGHIPGLGAPIVFTYNGTIQQEEPGP